MPATTSDELVPRDDLARDRVYLDGPGAMTTSHWSHAAVAAIAERRLPEAPLIGESVPILLGFDLWDFWPVLEEDGRVATIDGGTLYFFLAAPAVGDPEERHGRASLRLFYCGANGWCDRGPVFPEGFAPGSRQWSGSTIVDGEHRRLTLYFTAAGHRGETSLGFEQRLFMTSGALTDRWPPTVADWTKPVEVVAPDAPYMREMTGAGAIGTIKAFRDPFFFRDPQDGSEYLLFTASLAGAVSQWNGVIGVARGIDGGWSLEAPLIDADGVNNELERPHIVVRDGRYYCFWSTQTKVFADGGPKGPTGLYGMCADRFRGPWRPLNGSGLIFCNPVAAPHQAYSWLVLDDLRVLSFADFIALSSAPTDAASARGHFGGTPAPQLRLRLDGDTAELA